MWDFLLSVTLLGRVVYLVEAADGMFDRSVVAAPAKRLHLNLNLQ